MKPNRRKAVVSDPIKRIGLNGGNSAREIVIQIARALGFKIHEDDKGVSAYGGNAIRIADHCTYMQTWVDNGTWNAPIRLDVVIEDEPTEAVTQVRIGYDFNITEFVSQSNDIDPQKARMIAYDIRNTMNGNPYANNVRGERRNLIATHGNNPQELNCNTNMNKKLIRLTESDLHRIVKESVNRVLKEAEYNFASGTGNYDVNSDEWKTNYDRMSNDYRGQERKSNSNLMDLQIAHHNGMKGRGDYNGELPKTKQMYPKGKAESIDTIISSGLRRVNGGISPSEAFSDFKPFSEEEKQYYSDDMISQYYIPIGTVYGDTFMLIYDTKKEKYIVPKEPIEL